MTIRKIRKFSFNHIRFLQKVWEEQASRESRGQYGEIGLSV